MAYDKKQIDRFAESGLNIHRVIENAHKAVKANFTENVRDILALFYGRHKSLLERDIEQSFKRDSTKLVLKKLMHTKNFTYSTLVESSLAYAEKPVVRVRDKRAVKKEEAEPVEMPEPRIAMPEAIDDPEADPAEADPAEEADAAGDANADPSKTTLPDELADDGTGDKSKQETEGDLTPLWNDEIDGRKQFWQQITDAEPLGHAVGGVFMLAAYRPVAGVDQMTWTGYTPDCLAVVQQLEATEQAELVAIDQYIDDTDPQIMGDSQLIRRAFRIVITPTLYKTLEKKSGDSIDVSWFPRDMNGKNPYGFIPGVMLRPVKPESGSFYGPIAEDLETANRQYNLLSTELRMWERFQGFGVFWVTGLKADEKDEIDISPMSVLELKSDGNDKASAGYLNSNLKIAETEQRRQNIVRDVADDYGLAPQDISGEDGSAMRQQSGEALKQLSARLIERTHRTREKMNDDIKLLIAMSFLIWKHWNGDHPDAVKIPEALEDIEVELKFPPLRRAADDAQASAERRSKINDGLDTWEAWYMEQHPECSSAEEARQIIMRNKQMNSQLNPAAQSFSQSLALMSGRPQFGRPNQPPPGVTPPQLKPTADAAAAASAAPPPQE